MFLSTYASGSFTSAITFYDIVGELFPDSEHLIYVWNATLFPVTAGVFEVLFSLLCALYGFTYLHKKKEEHFFCSLPLKKDTLYRSNLFSSFLLYAIPWLGALLVATPFVIIWGREGGFLPYHYIYSMVARLAVFVISYSTAVLATVLSGRRFFAVLLFLLLNYMFPLIEELIYLCLEDNLFGLTFERNGISVYFSPISCAVEFVQEVYTDYALPWLDMGLYVGVAVLLFLLSGYLCRRRKTENAEQTPVFPSLTLFVQYLLTLMIAFLAAIIMVDFDVIFDYDSPLAIPIVCLLPVAFFLCRMIILRTVKVFKGKAFVQCGALVAFFVCVLLFFRFDILGLTRHIPEVDKVERLTVSINRMTYTTEDPEDIADFVKVHELIVGFKDVLSKEKADPSHNFIRQWDLVMEEDPTYFGLSYSLEVSYEMKGRDLHRSYNLSSHEKEIDLIWSALGIYFRQGGRATQQLLQVYDNAEHITVSGRLWEADPNTLDGPRYSLSTSQKEALFQALLTDIEDTGMPLILQHGSLYGVEITMALKNGGFCVFYLDYHCHETARKLLDSIIDTYANPT
ncbi:MAG: hypothetical protein IKM59_03180 [Oscillospiraceae bacterium]|nr:hypothetical protein [Oscillospiraceae bacterium]